jgi:hypothetical protein
LSALLFFRTRFILCRSNAFLSQAYIVTMKSKEDRYGNGSVHRSPRQYAFWHCAVLSDNGE